MVCDCKNGWTLSDCSMSEETFEQLIQAKIKIVSAFQETYDSAESNTGQSVTIEALKNFSNPEFNNYESSTAIKESLDSVIDQSNTNLSKEETEAVSEALSNLLLSASKENCKGNDELLEEIQQDMEGYLKIIGGSSLN